MTRTGRPRVHPPGTTPSDRKRMSREAARSRGVVTKSVRLTTVGAARAEALRRDYGLSSIGELFERLVHEAHGGA